MVNNSGQLYTIEGLSAAILMIVTAYIILSTTTLFTPGEAHVVDLQLEQLGNDALAMMDTPDSTAAAAAPPVFKSDLSTYIESDAPGFKSDFLQYINEKTDSPVDNLQFNAKISSYSLGPPEVVSVVPFISSGQTMTGREHAVTVSRLVLVTVPPPPVPPALGTPPLSLTSLTPGPHYVLIEVTLWRA
ncbi:MAG: hypothetical protein WCP36_09400 [Methanomicrobiales archaeon]